MGTSDTWTNILGKNVLGMVVANYQSQQEHHLNARFGDVLRVREECGAWYLCESVKGENFNIGIIPKNYVKITTNVMKQSCKKKQFAKKFKASIWISLHRCIDCLLINAGVTRDVSEIIGTINYLIDFSNRLENISEISSKEISIAIDLHNDLARTFKFLPCSYRYGTLLDTEETIFPSLFSNYIVNQKTIGIEEEGAESTMAAVNSKLTGSRKLTDPFHFLLQLLRLDIQDSADYMLEFIIADVSSFNFISENYFHTFTSAGKSILLEDVAPVIFTNFSMGDLTSGLLLVVKLIELRKSQSDKDGYGETFKVFHSISAVNLCLLNTLEESGIKTFRLPFVRLEKVSKERVEEILIDFINLGAPEYWTNSIEVTIKKYNKPLALINSGFIESPLNIRCTISKNYLNEEIDTNEYYFNLNTADFKTFNKNGQYTIKPILTLRDIEGNMVRNSFSWKVQNSEEKRNYHEFCVSADSDTPYWNELVRCIMPKHNIDQYFLCLVFKKYSEKNNNLKFKDRNSNAWCLSHFQKKNNFSIETGQLKLPYYKMKSKNQDLMKVNDLSLDGDREIVKMINIANVETTDSKTLVHVNVKMLSNRHSKDPSIAQLINYKKKDCKISDIVLKQASYADLYELVVFFGKLLRIGIDCFDSYKRPDQFKSFYSYLVSVMMLPKYLDSNDLIKRHKKSLPLSVKLEFFRKFCHNSIKLFEQLAKETYELKQLVGFMMESIVFIINTFKPQSEKDLLVEDLTSFRDTVKNFFNAFNDCIKDVIYGMEAYVLKYIVICPELIKNLHKLLEPADLNNIVKSVCEADQVVNSNAKKANINATLTKVTENYFNTLLAISASSNKELAKLSARWIMEKASMIISSIKYNQSAVEVSMEVVKVLELVRTMQPLSFSSIPLLFLTEQNTTFCLQEINDFSFCESTLKLFCCQFSLLDIVDGTIFLDFLVQDYADQFNFLVNTLYILQFFISQLQQNGMNTYLLEKCSEIAYKYINRIYEHSSASLKKDDSYKHLNKHMFTTTLSIIKVLILDESLPSNRLSRKYAVIEKSITNHMNIVLTLYRLDNSFKSLLYAEISTIISYFIYQYPTTNNLNIMNELLVQSCEEKDDVCKVIDGVFALIELHLDTMGTSVHRLRAYFVHALDKLNDFASKSLLEQFSEGLKAINSLIEVLSQCILVDQQINCSVLKLIRYQRILKKAQELGLTSISLALLHKLKTENEELSFNFASAKITRMLCSSKEKANIKVEQEHSNFPVEEDLLKAAEHDEKSRHFYCALRDCELLIKYYKKSGFPCDKIGQTYQRMADFSKALDSYDPSSVSFYILKFRGDKFPSFVRENKYVFYMGNDAKLGDVIEYFKKHIKFAQVATYAQKHKKAEKEESLIYLDNVKPKKQKTSGSASSLNQIMYEETVNRFSMTKVHLDANSPRESQQTSMVSVLYKIDVELPTYLPFGVVIDSKKKIMTELDQTIANLKACTEDMAFNAKRFAKDVSSFNMLLMKLQGNMVAKVNGGIEKLIEKYFLGNYFTDNRKESPKLQKLREFIEKFMNANCDAINLCSSFVPFELLPLLREIIKNYEISQTSLNDYDIVCNFVVFANLKEKSPESRSDYSQVLKTTSFFRTRKYSSRSNTSSKSKH